MREEMLKPKKTNSKVWRRVKNKNSIQVRGGETARSTKLVRVLSQDIVDSASVSSSLTDSEEMFAKNFSSDDEGNDVTQLDL